MSASFLSEQEAAVLFLQNMNGLCRQPCDLLASILPLPPSLQRAVVLQLNSIAALFSAQALASAALALWCDRYQRADQQGGTASPGENLLPLRNLRSSLVTCAYPNAERQPSLNNAPLSLWPLHVCIAAALFRFRLPYSVRPPTFLAAVVRLSVILPGCFAFTRRQHVVKEVGLSVLLVTAACFAGIIPLPGKTSQRLISLTSRSPPSDVRLAIATVSLELQVHGCQKVCQTFASHASKSSRVWLRLQSCLGRKSSC